MAEPLHVQGRPLGGEGCVIERPGPFVLVVFGASGDLARRKIIPAVYRLFASGLLPSDFAVLGMARTAMTDEAFRVLMGDSVREAYPKEYAPDTFEQFLQRLSYMKIDYSDPKGYSALAGALPALERTHRTGGDRIFYLAVPPEVYETVSANLGAAGLAREDGGYAHLVIEKPFGRDLASAERLQGVVRQAFEERQVYRMDHYLAKETVQNVLMFRFANSIFEPLWDRRYIDWVEITAAETLGVEHRAGYYESAGVLRDMFQNHIFQLLALTAMEPPSVFAAERVRDERVKVLRSVRPFDLGRLAESVALGQYAAGSVEGRPAPAYREEPGVDPVSLTPTYAAMRLYIDNWRWQGVPFYLRSGKRLLRRKAEIAVRFKPVPHLMFAGRMAGRIDPNTLVLRVQPDEGVNLHFQTKTPGSRLCLSPVVMDFAYEEVSMLEAYERALLDCMQGDPMLFVREDAVRESWALLTPAIERLDGELRSRGIPLYAAGSEGPEGTGGAGRIMASPHHSWRPL